MAEIPLNSGSHQELLDLVGNYTNEEIFGEHAIEELKGRRLELTSKLQAGMAELERLKNQRICIEEEVKGLSVEFSAVVDAVKVRQIKISIQQEHISHAASGMQKIEAEEQLMRNIFITTMKNVNSSLRLMQEKHNKRVQVNEYNLKMHMQTYNCNHTENSVLNETLSEDINKRVLDGYLEHDNMMVEDKEFEDNKTTQQQTNKWLQDDFFEASEKRMKSESPQKCERLNLSDDGGENFRALKGLDVDTTIERESGQHFSRKHLNIVLLAISAKEAILMVLTKEINDQRKKVQERLRWKEDCLEGLVKSNQDLAQLRQRSREMEETVIRLTMELKFLYTCSNCGTENFL